MSVIWNTIVSHFHKTLRSLLESGDRTGFESYVSQSMASGDMHGIEEPSPLIFNTDRYKYFLEKLAVKVGVLPMRNPEQNSSLDDRRGLDWESIQAQVEARLGFKLAPASVATHNGGIPHRMFHYAESAFDILMYNRSRFPKDVLEIGAGLGNLGIIASQLVSDTYSIIDLPTTSILSAYFLSKCLGPECVWLYGEPGPGKQFARIYPSTKLGEISISCDLAYNSDSFPEIPDLVRDQYLSLISKCLRQGGMFLSVNHESDNLNQKRVYDCCRRSGTMKLLSRHPFLMRDGYMSEMYYVQTP